MIEHEDNIEKCCFNSIVKPKVKNYGTLVKCLKDGMIGKSAALATLKLIKLNNHTERIK